MSKSAKAFRKTSATETLLVRSWRSFSSFLRSGVTSKFRRTFSELLFSGITFVPQNEVDDDHQERVHQEKRPFDWEIRERRVKGGPKSSQPTHRLQPLFPGLNFFQAIPFDF